MQPVTYLTVHLEYLTHELGLWCNRCMLGSAARVHFTMTIGPRTVLRQTLQCLDCGSHDVEAVA